MARPSLRVPARYYLRFPEVLARHNLDITQLFTAIGLPQKLLTEPDATLRFTQVEALIERLYTLTQRADLGFELGKLLSVSAHSFVGFGALSSPNVEKALTFIARYFRLVMPSFGMRYSRVADCAELHFTPTVAMGHLCLLFHLEAMAMAALRDVQEMTGGRHLSCQIHFSFPAPIHYRRYAELSHVKVEFGTERMPGVRLRFDADLREYPLMMADPNALKVAEERCRALVSQAARTGQFSEWVRMTLREVSEGLPALTELAATLNISPRTLNRYLEREGTNLRELSGQVQHELARERLLSGNQSITEVAYSLGFSNPANFTRAFRDREKCSPREFRARKTRKATAR